MRRQRRRIDDNWLTIQEVADYLGLSKTTVYRFLGRAKGYPQRLGCYKVGQQVWIDREKHLKPFLQKCEQEVTI